MRRLIILVTAMFLSFACTPLYPLNANLNLQIQPQSSGIYHGASASIEGADHREKPEILLYSLSGSEEGITNLNPPHILVAERLAGGFRQQGLLIESTSPVKIEVVLKILLVEVTRPKMLYKADATSEIQVNMEYDGATFTKTYNLNSYRESVTKPKVEELEEMLNTQLSDIVNEILDDSKIREFITNHI